MRISTDPTRRKFIKPFATSADVMAAGGKVPLNVAKTKLVDTCDLEDRRLEDAKKKWGSNLFTTRSYKEK